MTHFEYCKDGSTFRASRASVPVPSPEWRARAVAHLNDLTKPLGSLGRLEEIAARLVALREEDRPRCRKKAIFTMAADHGVTDEGVSAYPKAVTRQMVLNFLAGGAAINVLGRHGGIDVVVVDIGVDGDFEELAGLVSAKVARGSSNMARGPAMSEAELLSALGVGVELAAWAEKQGYTLIGTGEMGIGNTTAASAITSVLTGKPVAQVTGRGTGLDEPGLKRKIEVLERALAVNRPDPSDPLEVLRKVGGLEIAGLTGLVVGAAAQANSSGHRRLYLDFCRGHRLCAGAQNPAVHFCRTQIIGTGARRAAGVHRRNATARFTDAAGRGHRCGPGHERD